MSDPWADVRELIEKDWGIQNRAARKLLTDADALLAVVREPYLPTFDEVMARYEERDELDEYTVGMVMVAVRKLIPKQTLTALPEHLRGKLK